MSNELGSSSTKYEPLDVSQRQVRFMRMQHGADSGDDTNIVCELKSFSLNDDPDYVALSYAWTEHKATHLIYLNGTQVIVRPNLFNYLKLMHRERDSDWIFIDALCINQADVKERESQVSLMGDVYRSAREVIAWVGSSGDLLELVGEDGWLKWQRLFGSPKGIDTMFFQMPEDARLKIMHLFIDAFCNRSYWNRLWIVQEVVLARSLTIRWHTLRLRPEEMLHFTHRLLYFYYPDCRNALQEEGLAVYVNQRLGVEDASIWGNQTSVSAALFVCKILLYRGPSPESMRHLPLFEALVGFHTNKCTVFNDNVFALLGLGFSSLTPDYNTPPLELFIHTLIECTVQYCLAHFLCGREIDVELSRLYHWVLSEIFELDPLHPVVAAVITRVQERCGFIWSQKTVLDVAAAYMRRRKGGLPGSLKRWLERKGLFRAIAWARWKYVQLQLLYNRRFPTSKLPSCSVLETVCYEDLMDKVESIFDHRKNKIRIQYSTALAEIIEGGPSSHRFLRNQVMNRSFRNAREKIAKGKLVSRVPALETPEVQEPLLQARDLDTVMNELAQACPWTWKWWKSVGYQFISAPEEKPRIEK